MQRSRSALAAALVLGLAGSVLAAAKPEPPAAPARETEAFLRQMGDAQKWMGEELWHIKQRVEALPGIVAEQKDAQAAVQEQVEKLRDEVKGLYVELAGVRQEIAELKTEIAGVNDNVTGFRSSSGVFLALVLVMAVVSTVMTVLRR
jgi:septal ring factor EnvC (AmiA/AmiB activator)